RLDERHVALYVLDVCGHGVASALLSVSVRHQLSPTLSPTSLLRQPAADGGYRLVPPAELASELSRRFPLDPKTGQDFTLLYGILELESRELHFVTGGHPGPIHLSRTGGAVDLTCPSFPIGVVPGHAYDGRRLQLEPGDRLYFYSDGIPEAVNANHEQFGTAR